jgi:hypothetical protein
MKFLGELMIAGVLAVALIWTTIMFGQLTGAW